MVSVMAEKIKTWTLRFPAKENSNMEKVMVDSPIVLQYQVKKKYRLISRNFWGMKKSASAPEASFYNFLNPPPKLKKKNVLIISNI